MRRRQRAAVLSLDAAASTSALPAVAQRVTEFLPWYSSVHLLPMEAVA